MRAFALSLLAIATAYGVLAQVQKTIQGSGKKATKTVAVGRGKAVPPFTKVNLMGSFDLEVKGGPQSDIKITGDDNLLSLVDLKVEGDTLYVGTKQSHSTKIGMKVAFSSNMLNGIIVSGSGDVRLTDFKANNAKFSIKGAGDILASGKATSVDTEITGSGDIDLTKLPAKSATASIMGAGTIKVNASDKLQASVSGSGSVMYKGKPRVTKSITGAGEVRSF